MRGTLPVGAHRRGVVSGRCRNIRIRVYGRHVQEIHMRYQIAASQRAECERQREGAVARGMRMHSAAAQTSETSLGRLRSLLLSLHPPPLPPWPSAPALSLFSPGSRQRSTALTRLSYFLRGLPWLALLTGWYGCRFRAPACAAPALRGLAQMASCIRYATPVRTVVARWLSRIGMSFRTARAPPKSGYVPTRPCTRSPRRLERTKGLPAGQSMSWDV